MIRATLAVPAGGRPRSDRVRTWRNSVRHEIHRHPTVCNVVRVNTVFRSPYGIRLDTLIQFRRERREYNLGLADPSRVLPVGISLSIRS